jgi:hypothetical protein
MRMWMLLGCGLLSGCAATAVKPGAPAAVLEVPVATYVPIDAALTARCDWPRDAAPSRVFTVAAARRRCLERYEAQFEAIEQVQGRPVP